jgi:hypothetical protein
MYNYNYHVMQYCDGTNWQAMGPGYGAGTGTGTATDVTSGLLGRWQMDETSGANAADSSGNNHAGTATGTTIVAGESGMARSFSTSADYVNMGNVTSINGLSAVTVSAWIKAPSANANASEANVVDKSGCGGTAGDGPFELGLNLNFTHPHQLQFSVYPSGAGASYNTAPTRNVDDGNWHFIAGTYDGTTIRTYVDGAQDDSLVISGGALSSTTNVVDIGGYCTGHSNQYSGTVDDVRVYNRALSASEIQSAFLASRAKCSNPPGVESDLIYNSAYNVYQYCDGQNWQQAGVFGSLKAPTNGLIHWWKLDETSGTSASDSIGGNTATLTSPASFAPAWINYGVNLTGTGSSSLAVSTPSDMLGVSQLSESFWFKLTNTNSGNGMSFYQQPDAPDSIGIEVSVSSGNNHIYYDMSYGTGAFAGFGPFFTPDTSWHNAVLVFDGTQTGDANRLKGYLDGVQISGTANLQGSIPATTTTTAGTFKNDTGENGMIDDIRIYNRPLTASEVLAIYNAGL